MAICSHKDCCHCHRPEVFPKAEPVLPSFSECPEWQAKQTSSFCVVNLLCAPYWSNGKQINMRSKVHFQPFSFKTVLLQPLILGLPFSSHIQLSRLQLDWSLGSVFSLSIHFDVASITSLSCLYLAESSANLRKVVSLGWHSCQNPSTFSKVRATPNLWECQFILYNRRTPRPWHWYGDYRAKACPTIYDLRMQPPMRDC